MRQRQEHLLCRKKMRNVMKREKSNFDILGRIQSERVKRSWTAYNLAKNAGLTQSTISTWYRKNLQPSVASLEKICTAFGISLSEFFMDETESHEENYEENPSSEGGTYIPASTPDRKNLFHLWGCLSIAQRSAVLALLESMVDENGKQRTSE